MLFMPNFSIISSQYSILTIQMNFPHQNESADMLEPSTGGQISNICKFGYFWHFLATFGIEKCSLVTLLIWGHWNFIIKVYIAKVDIIKVKITTLYWGPKGWIFDFWKWVGEGPYLDVFNFGQKWSKWVPPTLG